MSELNEITDDVINNILAKSANELMKKMPKDHVLTDFPDIQFINKDGEIRAEVTFKHEKEIQLEEKVYDIWLDGGKTTLAALDEVSETFPNVIYTIYMCDPWEKDWSSSDYNFGYFSALALPRVVRKIFGWLNEIENRKKTNYMEGIEISINISKIVPLDDIKGCISDYHHVHYIE